MLKVGLDVLLKEKQDLIAGRCVGLATNQTGIDGQFRSNVALFAAQQECRLTALFSPEHGIWGSAQDAVVIPSTTRCPADTSQSTVFMERHASRHRRCSRELMYWCIIFKTSVLGSTPSSQPFCSRWNLPLNMMLILLCLTDQTQYEETGLRAICCNRNLNPLWGRIQSPSGTG